MEALLKNSSIGTLIRYFVNGKLSYSRTNIESLYIGYSPGKDITLPTEKEGDKPDDQHNIVTWEENDEDNPQNWPMWNKVVVTTLLSFYTLAVYVGSSLYTTSEQDVTKVFGVSQTESALGLALYVLGYGLGCLLFSPLSEIPAIGRNPPYAISGFLFLILCIPASLVNIYPGFMVLRFLLGFMCSPCLATAGASFADVWQPTQLPFAVAMWVAVASIGPSLGPLISSFAVERLGWRFSSWELLIISGPAYLLIILFLPETSGPTILYYRAKRLREHTGNEQLMAESEIKQKHLTASSLLWDALVKPWEVNIKEPAILFTTVYLGLVYGIFYSFFESIPLVYPIHYHFSATSTSLIFLAVMPAILGALTLHCTYLAKGAVPRLMSGTFGELENHLLPGLVASPLIPTGLFIFAWTSRPSIHWIIPTIGLAITSASIYLLAQGILMYVPMIYPRYAASILAANSLARSLFAFTAILVAKPMFDEIGVDGGVSLLADIMVVCMGGIWLLFVYGKALRERSLFVGD